MFFFSANSRSNKNLERNKEKIINKTQSRPLDWIEPFIRVFTAAELLTYPQIAFTLTRKISCGTAVSRF